jgi:hypothetical protein
MRKRTLLLTILLLFVAVFVTHQKLQKKRPVTTNLNSEALKPVKEYTPLTAEEAMALAEAYYLDQTGIELGKPKVAREIPRRAWQLLYPYTFTLNPEFQSMVITIRQDPERTLYMEGSTEPIPQAEPGLP